MKYSILMFLPILIPIVNAQSESPDHAAAWQHFRNSVRHIRLTLKRYEVREEILRVDQTEESQLERILLNESSLDSLKDNIQAIRQRFQRRAGVVHKAAEHVELTESGFALKRKFATGVEYILRAGNNELRLRGGGNRVGAILSPPSPEYLALPEILYSPMQGIIPSDASWDNSTVLLLDKSADADRLSVVSIEPLRGKEAGLIYHMSFVGRPLSSLPVSCRMHVNGDFVKSYFIYSRFGGDGECAISEILRVIKRSEGMVLRRFLISHFASKPNGTPIEVEDALLVRDLHFRPPRKMKISELPVDLLAKLRVVSSEPMKRELPTNSEESDNAAMTTGLPSSLWIISTVVLFAMVSMYYWMSRQES